MEKFKDVTDLCIVVVFIMLKCILASLTLGYVLGFTGAAE